MSSWKPNNRAATTTWLTLRTLAQIPKDKVFKKTGTIKMNENSSGRFISNYDR